MIKCHSVDNFLPTIWLQKFFNLINATDYHLAQSVPSSPSTKVFIFLKMCQPQPLFHLFSSFQTHITNFTTNNYEKCPSSTRCQDLNSRPFKHESPHITTRPRLPLFVQNYFCFAFPLQLTSSVCSFQIVSRALNDDRNNGQRGWWWYNCCGISKQERCHHNNICTK